MTVRECPRCHHVNKPEARFCGKCTLALTVDAWQDAKNEQDELKAQLREVKAELEHIRKIRFHPDEYIKELMSTKFVIEPEREALIKGLLEGKK